MIRRDTQGDWQLGTMPWDALYSCNLPQEYKDLISGALCKLKDYEETERSHQELEGLAEPAVYDPEMGEDKQAICDRLCAALQLTRGAYDLESIDYTLYPDSKEEEATLLWDNGHTTVVNVTVDSGAAMIRDIMNKV